LLALVAAAIALVLLAPIGRSWLPRDVAPALEDSIVLLSCNTMVGHADPDLLAQRIRKCDADVILLQECTPDFAAAMMERLGASHPHEYSGFRDNFFGQAVFSRLPFAEAPRSHPQGSLGDWARRRGVVTPSDPQLRVVVALGEQPVVIQSVHL